MCFLLSPLHWSVEEDVGDAHGMMEEPCLGLGKRGLSVNALLSRAVRSWVLLCPSWTDEMGFLLMGF
jgi:hypothetical protein